MLMTNFQTWLKIVWCIHWSITFDIYGPGAYKDKIVNSVDRRLNQKCPFSFVESLRPGHFPSAYHECCRHWRPGSLSPPRSALLDTRRSCTPDLPWSPRWEHKPPWWTNRCPGREGWPWCWDYWPRRGPCFPRWSSWPCRGSLRWTTPRGLRKQKSHHLNRPKKKKKKNHMFIFGLHILRVSCF